MNKIVKTENGTYRLICENGQEFECSRWFEKKTDAWHVLIPKEAREICGRTYIRESKVLASGIYEFDTKTEHRTGLGDGGWKSRLTQDELTEYQACETRMAELKELAMSRPVKEKTELEIAKAKLEKLQKQYEALLAAQANQN